MPPRVPRTHRIATADDVPAIMELMGVAIAENMKSFLSAAEIDAAQETMGVDRSLIGDGTYFIIETVHICAETVHIHTGEQNNNKETRLWSLERN